MTPRQGWVLDASVAIKLLVHEEGSEIALALLSTTLVAPELLGVECASALWKKERHGLLSPAEAVERLARLPMLPVHSLPLAELLPGALSRALRQRHPVNDCLYLEAAARTGFPVITDDRRLATLAGDGAEVVLLADLPPA